MDDEINGVENMKPCKIVIYGEVVVCDTCGRVSPEQTGPCDYEVNGPHVYNSPLYMAYDVLWIFATPFLIVAQLMVFAGLWGFEKITGKRFAFRHGDD